MSLARACWFVGVEYMEEACWYPPAGDAGGYPPHPPGCHPGAPPTGLKYGLGGPWEGKPPPKCPCMP